MNTDTDADPAQSMSKVLSPDKINQNLALYRDNFVKMLSQKQNKRDMVMYKEAENIRLDTSQELRAFLEN